MVDLTSEPLPRTRPEQAQRHTAQTARQLYGPGQARPEGIEHNLGRAARLVRPYVGTLEPRGRLWRPMFTG